MTTIEHLLVSLLMGLTTLPLWASPDEHHDPRPGPPPRLIVDQTASNQAAILANLPVASSPRCSKSDALDALRCNSVAVRGTDLQILLRGPDGTLQSAVGVNHPEGVDADRLNQDRPLDLLATPPIDLDDLRRAADRLSHHLPGRTGTLDWPTFLANVRTGRPMFGVVRVLVPLAREEMEDEDDARPHHAARSREDDDRCEAELDEEHLPPSARIEVYGSLLFDFVDCRTGQPLSPPSRSRLKITVPLLVNPVPHDNGAPRGLERLARLFAPGLCSPTPCTAELALDIPFSWIPPDRHLHWQLAQGRPLILQDFIRLPHAAQAHLLMPSGYVDGWLRAFQTLAIDQAEWRALGFQTPAASGPFTAADILSEDFQDLPALAYTGGRLDIHHHLNVSGLLYTDQTLELEQRGKAWEREEDEDESSHRRDRSRSEACEDEEDHRDHGRNGRSREDEETPCPAPAAARQYLNGAILVGGAFYLEAKQAGGITLLVNDPTTYSQIRLGGGPGQVAGFRPAAPSTAATSHSEGHPPPTQIPPPIATPDSSAVGEDLPPPLPAEPEWVEIHPLGR